MLWFFPFCGSFYVTNDCTPEANGTYSAIPQVVLRYNPDLNKVVGEKLRTKQERLTGIRDAKECPEQYKEIYNNIMLAKLKPEEIPYAIDGRIV